MSKSGYRENSCLKITRLDGLLLNKFEEAIATFFAMTEIRPIAQPKNFKYKCERASLKRKIGLPLNVYFCNCKSTYYLAATIIFDCVQSLFPYKYK